jgi:hypothetical protein
MPSFLRLTRHNQAAGAAVAAVAGLVALSGAASAVAAPTAPHLPNPGANLIKNGNFYLPKSGVNKGTPPTDWKLVNLGAEKKPYNAGIGAWNAKGKYPPPKGNPDKSDIADEIFYEGGSSLGVEGIGGQQTAATFGSITQKNNAQVSFSIVESSPPATQNSKWAGDGVEIVFTAGKHTDTLVYFSPWTTPKRTSYPAKPKNSATLKYLSSQTLKLGAWYTWKARSLNADIKKEFGVASFKVVDVRFCDLEDTINSARSPYPNEDGYIADLAVTEGK